MPGPRVFTVEQANGLLPDVEKVLVRLDRLKERLRAAKIRLNALELLWGERLREPDCPDKREHDGLIEELRETTESFNREAEAITAVGAVLKGVDPPLIDFYGVLDGTLVFLCWKRGERAIGHWHHVDAGFAGREPLPGLGGADGA